ncbi:hypothetical protein B0H11DRAFT_2385017 [Mycena galericulata]|nr:hypothetical protein B0H11DRAFT_2385017 [Mycena galericulata]
MTGFQFHRARFHPVRPVSASITTYMSAQTAFSNAREVFLPAVATAVDDTQNILTIVQEKDVDEFYNGSGITWKLSAQEARTIAAFKMVVFNPDNCPTDAIKSIIPRLAAAPAREPARVRIGNEQHMALPTPF